MWSLSLSSTNFFVDLQQYPLNTSINNATTSFSNLHTTFYCIHFNTINYHNTSTITSPSTTSNSAQTTSTAPLTTTTTTTIAPIKFLKRSKTKATKLTKPTKIPIPKEQISIFLPLKTKPNAQQDYPPICIHPGLWTASDHHTTQTCHLPPSRTSSPKRHYASHPTPTTSLLFKHTKIPHKPTPSN